MHVRTHPTCFVVRYDSIPIAFCNSHASTYGYEGDCKSHHSFFSLSFLFFSFKSAKPEVPLRPELVVPFPMQSKTAPLPMEPH